MNQSREGRSNVSSVGRGTKGAGGFWLGGGVEMEFLVAGPRNFEEPKMEKGGESS